MKILLVAPQSRDTTLGAIGNCCRKALVKIGVDLEVFDFRASQYFKGPATSLLKKVFKKVCSLPRVRLPFIRSLEQEKMNKALTLKVKEYSPDIILVLMGDSILPQTLEKIKQRGVILANWFHDPLINPDSKKFVKEISPYYDYFFIYDDEDVLNSIKINAPCVRNIPLACDPEVHKTVFLTPEEKKKYGSEICFVGSMEHNREELLRSLREFDLAIWGNWEKKDAQLWKYYRQKNIYGQILAKVYNACSVALDIDIFYVSGQRAFDINPRVYESTACGAFTMTNENPYLNEFYEIDKEIVCYSNEQDLKEKITFYLKHPEERKSIARNGQSRAHQDHTYEKRMRKIISIIKNKGA